MTIPAKRVRGMHDDVLARLQRLGVPGYEAKAYLALLSASRPLNGYEVAKNSGVPRSTVYETLTKLVRRGIAYEVKGAEAQTRYVPLPGDALVGRLQREFTENVEELSDALSQVTVPGETRLIHHLQGLDAVMARLLDLADAAKTTIHVTAWPDHLARLEPALMAAEARSVDVWIHAWGGGDAQLSKVYRNPLSRPGSPLDRTEWVSTRLGCHLLVVVVDHKEIISAGSMDGDVWGIYTDDPAAVLIGLETIVHYIVSDVAIRMVGPEKFLAMWEADPDLLRLATGAPAAGRTGAQRTGTRSLRKAFPKNRSAPEH